MSKLRAYQINGLNLRVNPMQQQQGDLLRAVNVQTGLYGQKEKRPGYVTYLGTANGNGVTSLFNWTKDDGTTFWNYRASGGVLYYSTQGTGAWTICGNGTLSAGAPIGNTVQNNTLIIGDGTVATRHTTSGTSFTNTSGAPVGQYWATYQNRAYVGGTGSVLTYSVTNDITNWALTGTSDSSSIIIPGPGKINQVFTSNDRLVVPKTSGNMFRWDGFNLVQIPTDRGPSSPKTLASYGDTWFYLNRDGFYNYTGDRPKLISLPIQRQLYNDAGKGINWGAFGSLVDNAVGVTHKYKYYCGVGTVADDITLGTVTNCIEVYDQINDEWVNYHFQDESLNTAPQAWLSYKDQNGDQQLIFALGNQCYTLAGTALNDNGIPISTEMMGVLNFGAPESDKEHKYLWAFFNPGAEAKIQVAMANTYTNSKMKWQDLGDCADGIFEFRFPPGSVSKLLFWRVYEASRNARFQFYGFSWEGNIIDRK